MDSSICAPLPISRVTASSCSDRIDPRPPMSLSAKAHDPVGGDDQDRLVGAGYECPACAEHDGWDLVQNAAASSLAPGRLLLESIRLSVIASSLATVL